MSYIIHKRYKYNKYNNYNYNEITSIKTYADMMDS